MKSKTLEAAFACILLTGAGNSTAQPFLLPTANRALFEKGAETRFFTPTPGKQWTSGTFGCVRSDGNQMHEGLDIRSLQHSRWGEPTDPINATANGVVAYVNSKSGLSNYGKYVILKHDVEGLEIYSLYAHLSEIRKGLKPGTPVRAGETIATMGRTTNTRSSITKDRAHLHFELNLVINDRFAEWFKKVHPGERNDHGVWNGRNMVGLDPRRVLQDQQAQGPAFSLRRHLQSQTEMCRVLVRSANFPFLRRYAPLIASNPALGNQPPAGYELVLNYNGMPFQMIPRPHASFGTAGKYKLLSVNAPEADRNPCRKLVMRHGNTWQLTTHGQSLLEQLLY